MQTHTRVALCSADERGSLIRKTVETVIGDIDWSTRQHVVVKPNLVMASQRHAITHRDTLATVLDCVRSHYEGRLTIAEGCAVDGTQDVFDAQEYPALADFYGCDLLDLNADDVVPITVYDHAAQPLHLRIARTIAESDCRISLSLPKTHDAVLVTLSIKNMIMASLVNRRMTSCHGGRSDWLDRIGQIIFGHGNGWGSDKVAMHQNYPIMNINLALLAPVVWPHLSILDGFVAMEGEGPMFGDPVPWRVAFAGTDALAVDVTAAELMGFPLEEVGYLYHCARRDMGVADRDDITYVGNATPADIARVFRPHPEHEEQRRWQHPSAPQLLASAAV